MDVVNNGINTARDSEVNHEIKRKPYSKPRLEKLGDLRALTLGGSPGFGDSGAYTTQNPPVTRSGLRPFSPESLEGGEWPPTVPNP